MSRKGLIVFDLYSGDAVYHLVDEALWDQINRLHVAWGEEVARPNRSPSCTEKHTEIIGWLTCDDKDVYRPEGAPDREGQVIKTWFTQTYVVEEVELDGVVGILTFP